MDRLQKIYLSQLKGETCFQNSGSRAIHPLRYRGLDISDVPLLFVTPRNETQKRHRVPFKLDLPPPSSGIKLALDAFLSFPPSHHFSTLSLTSWTHPTLVY